MQIIAVLDFTGQRVIIKTPSEIVPLAVDWPLQSITKRRNCAIKSSRSEESAGYRLQAGFHLSLCFGRKLRGGQECYRGDGYAQTGSLGRRESQRYRWRGKPSAVSTRGYSNDGRQTQRGSVSPPTNIRASARASI